MNRVKEKWKQLEEYPDYAISSNGRVRSLITGKILIPGVQNEYFSVTLYNEQGGKNCYIHRLVASNFISNIDSAIYNQVNHIDGNKKNNNVSNLEWVTAQGNKKHAIEHGLIKKFGRQKKVIQMDLDGNIIGNYHSASEAARVTGISQGNISNVCRGYGNRNQDGSYVHHITAGGYMWKYGSY